MQTAVWLHRGFKCGLLLACCSPVLAQAKTLIWMEPGLTAADTVTPDKESLAKAMPGGEFANASTLAQRLDEGGVELLVLPYGSAYPETAWPAILRYLDHGGNLLAVGGKPLTRAAHRENGNWLLRSSSVAATLELFINDYQQTQGSAGLTFEANQDVVPDLPEFSWKRAFSPVIRLSVVGRYVRSGTTGGLDGTLETLAWGTRDRHHVSAPLIEIDHDERRFVGGRWIFLNAELTNDFYSDGSAARLLPELAMIAVRRHDRFSVRPRVPLFVPGESIALKVERPAEGSSKDDRFAIRVTADGMTPVAMTLDAETVREIDLPAGAASGSGLHTISTTLLHQGKFVRRYRSGYWLRDLNFLRTGPRLTVGRDYFQLDGSPLPVVGTTYMSSDVQRFYLTKPNAFVWDRDLAQIHDAGLNMFRTGIWSGWDTVLGADGGMTEEGLRSVEAMLMSARKYRLPVQFNVFAFLPEVLGGDNAYLDPVAIRAQQKFIASLVSRFGDVPYLAWDLINEPSFNGKLWRTRPSGDVFEQAAWKQWLTSRYPDKATLLHDYAETNFGTGRQVMMETNSNPAAITDFDPFALPTDEDFEPDAVRSGHNPLKVYDYYVFTQEMFTRWTQTIVSSIREQGSHQLITVGQEEKGVESRVSPVFFGDAIDFTTNHTWWDFDSNLWASLSAKIAAKPMLIQETGEQRRLQMDDHLRLTADEEAWQLERKLVTAFAGGAGALEWLWNVNPYMSKDDEITIGAVRADGTEKPEALILSGVAKAIAPQAKMFVGVESAPVAMVVPQVPQYSSLNSMAVETQKHALRALAYEVHQPAMLVAENRLGELGHPKLVILPSAQALSGAAWTALLHYVADGGVLLVTGPIARDEHWMPVNRELSAPEGPISVRQSELRLPDGTNASINYPSSIQQLQYSVLQLPDGASLTTTQHGKGKILWASDPVELGEGFEAVSKLYRYALTDAKVAPSFEILQPLSPGVLVYPTLLSNAVLYSFACESLQSQQIDIKDAVTGRHIRFTLGAQRGAMLLLSRSGGQVLASYGGAKLADQ